MSQKSHQGPARLVIASRESALAMWQAEHIRDRLRALYPQTEVSILGMTTQGDQILDVTLSKIGGKGLFVKELETALEDGRADLAVHSLKDVPMNLPEGFVLAVIGEREDPHDAFVSNKHENLASLPSGSVVGTSSLRRDESIARTFSASQDRTAARQRANPFAQTGRGAICCHYSRRRRAEAPRVG